MDDDLGAFVQHELSSGDPHVPAELIMALPRIAPASVALGLVASAPADRSSSPAWQSAEREAGSRAAAQALAHLGQVARAPLPIPGGGARHWPAGIVGSISHVNGLALAGVALAGDHAALGLDLERCVAPAEDITPLILSRAEQAARPDAIEAGLWLMLHFSAKESVYKAISASAGGFVDFQEVALRFEVETGQFRAIGVTSRLSGCGIERLIGRFVLAAGLVATLTHAPGRPGGWGGPADAMLR